MEDLPNPEEKPVGMIDRIKNKSTVLYEENKTACIVGVVVATNVATLLIAKRLFAPIVINNIVAPVFNNENIGNVVNNGGHLVKYVKNLDTGVITKGIGKAAEEAGVSASTMSNHLHGRGDHIKNVKYAIDGIGTTR